MENTKGETIITFAFDWCGQMGIVVNNLLLR